MLKKSYPRRTYPCQMYEAFIQVQCRSTYKCIQFNFHLQDDFQNKSSESINLRVINQIGSVVNYKMRRTTPLGILLQHIVMQM